MLLRRSSTKARRSGRSAASWSDAGCLGYDRTWPLCGPGASSAVVVFTRAQTALTAAAGRAVACGCIDGRAPACALSRVRLQSCPAGPAISAASTLKHDSSHTCRLVVPLRDACLWCSLVDRQHPACVTAIPFGDPVALNRAASARHWPQDRPRPASGWQPSAISAPDQRPNRVPRICPAP